MFSNTFLVTAISAASILYFLYSKYYTFWRKKGVTGPLPLPIVGCFYRLLYKPLFVMDFNDFKKYGTVYGTYEMGAEKLVVNDVEILKRITVKDANIWPDRSHEKIPESDVLNKVLTVLTGDEWRRVRKVMTPAFTSGKLRQMYPLISKSVDSFLEILNEAAENKEELDLKKLWGCYTLDVIAKCCFATNLNSFKDQNNIFVQNASKMLQFNFINLLEYVIVPTFVYKAIGTKPRLFKSFDFFENVVNEVIDQREKLKEKHNDFLQMMLDVVEEEEKNSSNEGGRKLFDRNLVVAQSILFLLAGYETTSLLLTFSSYILATNPEIQDELSAEIVAIASDDKQFDYEKLMSAPYLNAFISETLRYYPPAVRFERISVADYSIPEYNINLPKQSTVLFSPYCIHRNPLYYSEPDVFDPKRFMPDNVQSINQYAFIPFGLGPRNCIGNRFAMLETKLALAKTLLKYRIVKTNLTRIPLKFPNGFILVPNNCVFAGFEKR